MMANSRQLEPMGYSASQLNDLIAAINAISCDSIVVATPVNLARLIPLAKPSCRMRYDLEEISRPNLAQTVKVFLSCHASRLQPS